MGCPATTPLRALVTVAEIDAAALPSVVGVRAVAGRRLAARPISGSRKRPQRPLRSDLPNRRAARAARRGRHLSRRQAAHHGGDAAALARCDARLPGADRRLHRRRVPALVAMQEQKIVFKPQGTNMSFVFMTVEKDRPAAVKSLKIYKLDGEAFRGWRSSRSRAACRRARSASTMRTRSSPTATARCRAIPTCISFRSSRP